MVLWCYGVVIVFWWYDDCMICVTVVILWFVVVIVVVVFIITITTTSSPKHYTTSAPHYLPTNIRLHYHLTSLPHFSTTLLFSLFLHELLNRYPPFEPFATHRFKVSEVHELYVEQSGNPNGKVFKIQDRKKKERERRRKEMK